MPVPDFQSLCESFQNPNVRRVAERLVDAATRSGALVQRRKASLVIRVNPEAWKSPVTIAWLFWTSARWMRTHEFSFGWTAWEKGFPQELRAALDGWADQFSTDSFARDVSGKCVTAWAVSHEDAVEHQEVLVERLRCFVGEVGSPAGEPERLR